MLKQTFRGAKGCYDFILNPHFRGAKDNGRQWATTVGRSEFHDTRRLSFAPRKDVILSCSTPSGDGAPSYSNTRSNPSVVGGGSVRRSSAHVPIGVNRIGGRSPPPTGRMDQAGFCRRRLRPPIIGTCADRGQPHRGTEPPSYRSPGSRRSFFVGGGSVRRSSAPVPIGLNPSGDGAPSYSKTRSDPSVVGGGASELAIVFRKPDQSLNRRPQRTRRIRDPLTLS